MDGTPKLFLPTLFLLCSSYEATSTIENGTLLDSLRQPRVSGRIVKLYSGSRPEPIYCSGEGFQADPQNCAIFYRCIKSSAQKYTVFRFQCGPGTVYDPETEVCNHPRSTKRSECWDNTAPATLTEKHRENEIPQEWSRPELPSPISTPFSTKYPVYLNQNLGETTPSSTSNSWSNNFSTEFPQKAPEPPKKSNSNKSNQCSKDGFMGDSENCSKFYRCVGNQRGGYIRYEFSCSDNTVWDDDAKSCNHPWAVQRRSCGSSYTDSNKSRQTDQQSSSSDNTLVPSRQEQTQISYGSKVSQTQTQISHGPVTQNQTQINYGDRNKKDNSQTKQNQTQISYGSAISQTQTQIDHGNKGVQTQLQIDHSKENSQTQTQEYETTSMDSTTKKDEENGNGGQTNNSNGNKCTESGFMGDQNDCKKFYRCVDNGKGGYTKYEFTCGEGTVWDTNIDACNHAWAVKKCGGKEPGQSSTQSAPMSTTLSQQTTAAPVTGEEEDLGYGNQNPPSGTTTSTQSYPVNSESNQSEQTTTTTKKPPSQSNNNECQSSGFVGDKNDCNKFYRCVDNGNGGYTRYEFSCGEGTVWDPKFETCNHRWAVEKCGGQGNSADVQKEPSSTVKPTYGDEYVEPTQAAQTEEVPEETDDGYNQPGTATTTTSTTTRPSSGNNNCDQEGFMGDSTDCKKFYRCVDNGRGGFTKYEFSCGEGTIWDSEINSCNHERSVKRPCTTSSSQTESSQSTETDSTTKSSQKPTQTTTESMQVSGETTEKPDNKQECSQEGFYGDEKDCKKFYRCVDNGKGGYTKYEFTCGEGTVWDQEILGCNHDKGDKKCKSSQQSQSSSSTEGSTGEPHTTTQSSNENQSTTEKTESSSSSSSQCTGDGFFANPDDCKKFYRCVDNGKGGYTKYDFSCGDGTIWVQEIQACDHDNDKSMCKSSQSSSSTSPTQTTQEPTNVSESTTTSPIQQPEKEDDEYPEQTSSEKPPDDDKCDSEGFHANKNDCRRFYRCVDNGNGGYTKYDFDCGEGTAWDSNIQSCNHINEVESCQGQQTQNKPMQDEQSTESSDSNNNNNNNCTTSTSGPSTESTKPASKDKCEKEGYYGNSEDCTKFYRCVDNGNGGFTKYDFDCGEGTIWDQDITACNHPRDVSNPSCEQSEQGGGGTTSSSSSSSSSTTTTTTTSSSDQSSSSSTTEGSGSGDCGESSSKKPANKNVNCTKAGYYGDPDDCKKFYRCVDWDGDGKRFSVYHFECGEGTIWDPALDTCNHEDSVYPPRDCSGSQSQGEPVTQETTEGTTAKQEEPSTTEESTTQQSTTDSTEESTTQKTTQSSQENTTEQSQQTTSEEQTTTQGTIQQTTEAKPEQTTTEEQTTTQGTTQQTTEAQPVEETTTQQSTTAQTTTQESTTSQQTEQTTSKEESPTTESSTQENTTEQATEGTTQDSTTESSENQTESQTDETQTTESQTEESQTEENQTESQTEENQTESQTEESNESTTESSSSSEKECPETDDDQNVFVCPTSFRRHPKYCNIFYQCTEDDDTHDANIATFHCPNNTIYDESQVKCVEEDKAEKKCDGEIAQKRRFKRLDTSYKEPIVVTKEVRLKCPAVGHFPFEKYECSSAFLKCQKSKSGKVRGYVYQCPPGLVYWSVSRRCEPKGKVQDCKQSYNNWSGRWEIPIERRNVAP